MKRKGIAPVLMAAVLLGALSADATTISITGLAGTTGTSGAAGDPGGDGGTGGDGQDVLAEAVTPGENNTATATGGAGGVGGAGGAGVPSGADGGDGGDGGAGGDAIARAIGSGSTTVSAAAIPGTGGVGGSAGSASAPGAAGEAGVQGRVGASLAEATLDTNQASLATAYALAGKLDPYVPGFGQASASAMVDNAGGSAHSSATSYSDSSAIGASGATATARGTANSAEPITVSTQSRASGLGDRTSTAVAYGSNAGSGPLIVTAFASNSANLMANDRHGELSATAEGYSTGGGDVIVESIVSRTSSVLPEFGLDLGGEVVLHDAVRGSTSGHLTLRQVVNSLPDGTSLPLNGRGSAITSIDATNPGGGALSVDISARAGWGAETVLGDILATSVTGADVDIDVFASSLFDGKGIFQENRDDGSPPSPSRIYAESNGGDVRTSVTFAVGDDPDSQEGSAIHMIDVATGDTTGALTLEQTAQAGGGLPSFFDGSGNPLPAGSGGDALSSLTKQTASASLELHSTATGGSTSFGELSSDRHAGDATALVTGSNSAGPTRVIARAEGGHGQLSPGGDALVEANASTTGDGHAVWIGQETVPNLPPEVNQVGARGGDVTCAGCPADSFPAPGDAVSRSTGSAEGDSTVTVFDLAVGGTGRGAGTRTFGGVGGSASSTATATGGGISTVIANSEGYGGRGGQGQAGGNAEASATATGLGQVQSFARAVGGDLLSTTSSLGNGGSAIALATADGATGFARAEAISGSSSLPRLRAQSEAQVGSQRDVAAAATNGAALASAPNGVGLEGSAFFTSAPLQADVDAALAGNAAMSQSFAAAPMNMLALARWQADSSDGPLSLSTDLELTLAGPGQGSRPFALGAFGVSLTGDGFESLSFSLAKNGTVLDGVHTFATVDEVLAFFVNSLIDLGTGWNAGDKLLAHFDLELGAGTRIEMGIAYAVPEPGTGVLLFVGLILFAIYRVTSKPAAIRSHVA